MAVFDDGKVMGGDNGYYYLGSYTVTGNQLRATIDVIPFVAGIESVFNTLGRNLKLDLSGTLLDDAHATAQGAPVGMPGLKLGVKLTKRT